MKIIIVVDWFAESMGYAENCLPKAFASLGYETHVVTSNVKPYFNFSFYNETYKPFLGPAVVPCDIKSHDGYMLHRLPHRMFFDKPQIKDLRRYVLDLHPTIIQTFEPMCIPNFDILLARLSSDFPLFIGSHIHASVFQTRLKGKNRLFNFPWILYKYTWGQLVNHFAELCYAISKDSRDIVIRYMGIHKDKVKISPLGVDTEIFRPAINENIKIEKDMMRDKLGFKSSDIICIYAGRFTYEKGVLVLAKAINYLNKKDKKYKALFVGNGIKYITQIIRNTPGCTIVPFVPNNKLPIFYQSADIGVWPMQESTSMLDAAACGLPIIVSNNTSIKERIEGNGLYYNEGNFHDLAKKIEFLSDYKYRKRMGDIGYKKMIEKYSWNCIAKNRIRDYHSRLQFL